MLRLLQLSEDKECCFPRLDRRGHAVLWAAVLLLTTLVAGAANVTASLDRDTITLGETATLTLDFEGGAPKAFPALPSLPNLQIAGRGTSTSLTFVNGQSSSTESHTFMLAPAQPGEYTI